MKDTIEAILNATVHAPSGDNTQPWHFIVDFEAGTIVLAPDESRDPSPMNANQRMARIALGAALENLLCAARELGVEATLEPTSGAALAKVRLANLDKARGQINRGIASRVTNRHVYNGRAVPAEIIGLLKLETPELDGARTHWITGTDRLAALSLLIGRADAAMFGNRSMRKAFLAKVRFDLPPDAPAAEGLSLGSLELSAADRIALRAMPHLPDWLLRNTGAPRVFAAKARQLVASASGLCLVVAPDGDESTDLVVGRAMQRAWLALTAQGLAVQPMMSLCVLQNVLEHGEPDLIAALGAARVAALGDEFRALVPEIGGGRPAFLMRFGYASPPSARTRRLPIEASLEAAIEAKPPHPPGELS